MPFFLTLTIIILAFVVAGLAYLLEDRINENLRLRKEVASKRKLIKSYQESVASYKNTIEDYNIMIEEYKTMIEDLTKERKASNLRKTNG